MGYRHTLSGYLLNKWHPPEKFCSFLSVFIYSLVETNRPRNFVFLFEKGHGRLALHTLGRACCDPSEKLQCLLVQPLADESTIVLRKINNYALISQFFIITWRYRVGEICIRSSVLSSVWKALPRRWKVFQSESFRKILESLPRKSYVRSIPSISYRRGVSRYNQAANCRPHSHELFFRTRTDCRFWT